MTTAPTLALESITAGFGGTLVLRDVSIAVQPGQVCALLGANGAGKTTTLRIAAGLLRPRAGTVLLHGTDVTTRPAFRRRRAGLCLVPEGRGVFPTMTVRENLLVQVRRGERGAALDRALDAFPALRDRLGQRAGTLSGGQQQMLALARCYLSDSDVVLVDEVSMGLAPIAVDALYQALEALRRQGVALLLVEQYVDRALQLADVVHVLNRGRIVHVGTPAETDRDTLMRRYLRADPVAADAPSPTSPSPTGRAPKEPTHAS
jgi:branched-chain amino acid transport system ATP-binding protein